MNEITPATLPTLRAKWLAAASRGRLAAAQLEKLTAKIGTTQRAVDEAIKARQAVADVRSELERDRNEGNSAERQLKLHLPAEITQFLVSMDSRRRSLFARRLELQTKLPRMITTERIEAAHAELREIDESIAAIDERVADVDRRILSDDTLALTDEERALILSPELRVGRAAVSSVLADNAHAATTFGTPGGYGIDAVGIAGH